MKPSPSAILGRLERLRDRFGDGSAGEKVALLEALDRRRLRSAAEVERLHETLCFLHAWSDDDAVRARARAMLARFADRSDLRRFARRLADTGIAGTAIRYPFYWTTARWLDRRWPGKLAIDWNEFAAAERLDHLLFQLVPYVETLALDEADLSTRAWIDLLKGPGETDAHFVLERLARLRVSDDVREKLYEDLEITFVLAPGPGTPARTGAEFPGLPVVHQVRPLDRRRPDLRAAVAEAPVGMRPASPREAERLIGLAREAMVTRARDLYSFKYADPRDVRLIDCGEGLQFAAMGLVPERRLMLDTVYGFLTLRSGVPIGYVLTSACFRSAEVAYNVFETFRGGESARIYGRVLAMVRWLFDADTFTIDPYQLGHDNDEGLRSGAWWFYWKLGFRPRDAETLRLVRAELAQMKKDPGHRSSRATLNRLSAVNMFYRLGPERDDVLGVLSLGTVGLAVSRRLAARFGSDRERALTVSREEAGRLLGVRSLQGWTAGERLLWERWGPLVAVLPGVASWSAANRRALVDVIRAKGGRFESDYVRRLDAHRPLRRALRSLAKP